MKRLFVKWRDGYCNIPVTTITKEESIIYAFRDAVFVGMFDLGAVELLYVSEKEASRW